MRKLRLPLMFFLFIYYICGKEVIVVGKSKLTENDYKEIEKMIRDGYKYRIIAEKFKIDESRVRQIKKERDIEVDTTGRLSRTFKDDGTAYTSEDIALMKNMYKSGMGISDIAKRYDTNYKKIYHILRTHGIMEEWNLTKEIEDEICRLYNLGINIVLIQRVFELKGKSINIIKIADCLRRHNIPTRKYSPSKDINLRHDIISLKKDYNMSIKDIATVVDKSENRVRRILLEYKKTQSET